MSVCWGHMQVAQLLQYSPVGRITALQAMTHPFFDDLRDPATVLPNGAAPARAPDLCRCAAAPAGPPGAAG